MKKIYEKYLRLDNKYNPNLLFSNHSIGLWERVQKLTLIFKEFPI